MSVIISSRRPGLNVNINNCQRSSLIEDIEKSWREKHMREEQFSLISKKEFISKYGRKEWRRINRKNKRINRGTKIKSFRINSDGGQTFFGGSIDGPGVCQDSEFPIMDK